MGQLTSEQRIFIVEQYHSNKSPANWKEHVPMNTTWI